MPYHQSIMAWVARLAVWSAGQWFGSVDKDDAMCRMLYLGADRSLPLVKDDEALPGLWIQPLNPAAVEIIRVLEAMPYRYYVTTSDGCSCGFHYETKAELEGSIRDIPPDQQENFRARRNEEYQTVAALRHYLSAQRAHGPLLLYHLAQLDRPEDEREENPDLTPQPITPAYFGGEAFALPARDCVFSIQL